MDLARQVRHVHGLVRVATASMRASAVGVVSTALVLAGCAGAEDANADATEPAGGQDALIGGKPATVADLPATVYLKDGCTAAKVAPKRLLTAAHCVVDPATVSVRYAIGARLTLSREPAKGFTEHEVAAVHVHPAWIHACTEAYCGASWATTVLDAADVAVIELTDDLEGVPSASVDPTPLAVGDRVVILGFGCTEGALTADTRATATLQFAETRIIDGRLAIHEGSSVNETSLPRVAATYAMTPGPALADATKAPAGNHAGLCPGDSGGPLYRRRGEELVVVGINANYTFQAERDDTVGAPVTNWHTRIDDKSRHGIAAWLRSVGVAPL